MLLISESVDGASVAAERPSSARATISISADGRERGQDRCKAERNGADQKQLAPADAVAERAHGDQRAGNHEAVDVDDPEQLRRRRLQVRRDVRHGEVEHGQVHGIEQAGQRDDGEADPLAPAGFARGSASRWLQE